MTTFVAKNQIGTSVTPQAWETADSFSRALEESVHAKGTKAIFRIGELYEALELEPMEIDRPVHEIRDYQLQLESIKVLRAIKPGFGRESEDLKQIEKNFDSDIAMIRGLKVCKLDPRHSPNFDVQLANRFSTARSRLLHRRAYDVETYVRPRMARLTDEARIERGKKKYDYINLPYAFTVLSNSEVWLDIGKVGEGAFKAVSVYENLATGERIVSAKALDNLRATHKRESEQSILLEKRIYDMFKDARGVAQLYVDESTALKSRGALMMQYYSHDMEKLVKSRKCRTNIAWLGMARQLLAGMALMHKQGVYHRDIKPANVLVRGTEREIPTSDLADMGCAVVCPTERDLDSVYGTPYWMSPEFASLDRNSREYRALKAKLGGNTDGKGEPIARHFFGARDVWALGLTLYEMKYGRLPRWLPTDARTISECFRKIAQIDRRTQRIHGYLEPKNKNSLDYVIWQMLDPNPETRAEPMNAYATVKRLLLESEQAAAPLPKTKVVNQTPVLEEKEEQPPATPVVKKKLHADNARFVPRYQPRRRRPVAAKAEPVVLEPAQPANDEALEPARAPLPAIEGKGRRHYPNAYKDNVHF